ncbi:Serine/threonine-protein kinase dclk3 [Tulasnella sp. UAMH 9824]|nr:Serine/threonine-protein kinase dclk3 [Tulasnella sp. UAMH 9824]
MLALACPWLDIAHRDLKPQNILVFANESGNVDLKICDFGLASLSSEPISTDGWLATPYWMPPGTFMTHAGRGKLADCYAIGRILYFILTSSPWPMESRDANARCGCDIMCRDSCEGRKVALDVLLNAGAGGRCVDLLRNLLVAYPEECMDILEIVKHPYILKADAGPTAK